MILMNPLWNGRMRRRRTERETHKPAHWRANPPASEPARVRRAVGTGRRGAVLVAGSEKAAAYRLGLSQPPSRSP